MSKTDWELWITKIDISNPVFINKMCYQFYKQANSTFFHLAFLCVNSTIFLFLKLLKHDMESWISSPYMHKSHHMLCGSQKDLLAVAKLMRIEFHANTALETSLQNFFCPQELQLLSPYNNFHNSYLISSCSKMLDVENVLENYM